MLESKLPRVFAGCGVLIGFALMLMWLYIDKYNPFHLPTVEAVQAMPSYTAPALYHYLQTSTFILCPAALLLNFTIHAGLFMNCLVWVVAAFLNGPLYFAVGLAVRKAWTKLGAGS